MSNFISKTSRTTNHHHHHHHRTNIHHRPCLQLILGVVMALFLCSVLVESSSSSSTTTSSSSSYSQYNNNNERSLASLSTSSSLSPPPSLPILSVRLPRNHVYMTDWDEEEDADYEYDYGKRHPRPRPCPRRSSIVGTGREISIFDSRGGGARNLFFGNRNTKNADDDGTGNDNNNNNSNNNNNINEEEEGDNEYDYSDDFSDNEFIDRYRRRRSRLSSSYEARQDGNNRRRRRRRSSNMIGNQDDRFGRFGLGNRFGRGQRNGGTGRRQQEQQQQQIQFVQTVQDWWTTSMRPKIDNLPRIVCRIEPTTTLKIRKTFRPLKTIIKLGADFNTQRGVWQFKSSWEDAFIGGKLTLAGKELQLTKSWQLSVGSMEDLVTRLRFRAAINLQTLQAYARVGFRTERLSPINVMEGFTILKRLPLDGGGPNGNIKMEVKANIALPEPEIEYSTETQRRSLIGMGDIEVSIDEMNLVLDY